MRSMELKRSRYKELSEIEEIRCLTKLELDEKTQLFYELDYSRQNWRDENPHLSPEEIWYAQANGSQAAGF